MLAAFLAVNVTIASVDAIVIHFPISKLETPNFRYEFGFGARKRRNQQPMVHGPHELPLDANDSFEILYDA
ncbi:hypothetical protein K432DRAFT_399495 [Lepidopterella palustris CBS 459.81]|uniref:Secreted protein n=1 Tax=Lepidopterella palustris CBS 459.81 TaxID=1314670 RepID=A0A8E2JL29_9PEZI|nr:hypothetical protein K432DRAFT_399495 [Lepidopterella palustris CBS 459.81]